MRKKFVPTAIRNPKAKKSGARRRFSSSGQASNAAALDRSEDG
jgi:hypothetical protein